MCRSTLHMRLTVSLRFCGMQASGTLQSLPAESRTSFRFRNSENKGLIQKISK